MKVLHLIGSLERGGAELLLRDLCMNAPIDLSLQVVSKRNGPLGKDIQVSGINLEIINGRGLHIGFIIELRKLLRKDRIEIVHVHSAFFCIHAMLAALFTNTRIVLSVHGYSLNEKPFLKKLAFSRADSVCFVSKCLMKIYIGKAGSISSSFKYKVLHNGVDPEKFNAPKGHFRAELSIPEDSLLLGMVGNFNEVRDHLTICRSLKILGAKGNDFHFVFAGAFHVSNLFDECYAFCKENNLLSRVHFLGPRSDIADILSSLDLFVYASNSDTFGIAVVEAMMSGTPVVVNDLPVFQEITDNGKYALLYKTKDANDLAKNIRFLMVHPEERRRLGEAGRKWAVEKFSIQKHIEQLQTIYEEVLSRR